MSWRETITFTFNIFCAIITVQVLYMVIIFDVILGNTVESNAIYFLSRFSIVAVLCALPTLVLVRDEMASRKEIIIRKTIHLVLTVTILIGLLYYFRWLEVLSAVRLAFVFLVVYLSAFRLWDSRSNQTALLINKRIHQIQIFENYESKANDK